MRAAFGSLAVLVRCGACTGVGVRIRHLAEVVFPAELTEPCRCGRDGVAARRLREVRGESVRFGEWLDTEGRARWDPPTESGQLIRVVEDRREIGCTRCGPTIIRPTDRRLGGHEISQSFTIVCPACGVEAALRDQMAFLALSPSCPYGFPWWFEGQAEYMRDLALDLLE